MITHYTMPIHLQYLITLPNYTRYTINRRSPYASFYKWNAGQTHINNDITHNIKLNLDNVLMGNLPN